MLNGLKLKWMKTFTLLNYEKYKAELKLNEEEAKAV